MLSIGIGLPAVSKFGAAALTPWLLGIALSGCSLAGPSEHSFSAAEIAKSKPDAKSEQITAKMQSDRDDCRSQAKLRGISSVLAIIRSADRSNTDKEYIACMQKKGYKIEGEAGTPAVPAAPAADQGSEEKPE